MQVFSWKKGEKKFSGARRMEYLTAYEGISGWHRQSIN